MDIREFVNLEELEAIQEAWANATGLAAIFTDAQGEYITGDYNFTDFCIKLTRGSQEGLRRCVDTDQNGLQKACLEKGCYKCQPCNNHHRYLKRCKTTHNEGEPHEHMK